jgi:hypothetical protein
LPLWPDNLSWKLYGVSILRAAGPIIEENIMGVIIKDAICSRINRRHLGMMEALKGSLFSMSGSVSVLKLKTEYTGV